MGLTAEELSAKVARLAPDLTIQIVKNQGTELSRFSPLATAGSEEIAFLANPKYAAQLQTTLAQAIVINEATWHEEHESIKSATVIVCNNPYAYFAFASQILEKSAAKQSQSRIHPTAIIDSSARVGKNVSIGAYSVIEANVSIADGCTLGSQVVIGVNAKIDTDSLVYSNVTIYNAVQLGKNCIIHSGSVIGSDGFGFAPYQKRWIKIPQTGTVIIGDDVEIGSNCSIDRGALGDTVIGRGTKLDNLIQIAHNVKVGEDCAFAANIAIAGSATIGNRVQMGGKAGVLGHLSVCDDVVISSCTLVTKTIAKAGFYSGVYPIQENAEWEKNAVALKRLNALRIQVRELEQALKASKIE